MVALWVLCSPPFYFDVKRDSPLPNVSTVQTRFVLIVKKRHSAFFGTSLDELLATLSPDVLVLAGINTQACIRATAIDAYQRDFDVVLAGDCVASYDREQHDSTLRYVVGRIANIWDNETITSNIRPAEGH